MSLAYTWELTGLKKQSGDKMTDAVVQTYWKCTGTDADGNSGTFNGATPFDLNTIDSDNFTPYEDLTEKMVLEWVKEAAASYKDHIEEQIIKQITLEMMPQTEVSEGDFPWSQLEEEVTND